MRPPDPRVPTRADFDAALTAAVVEAACREGILWNTALIQADPVSPRKTNRRPDQSLNIKGEGHVADPRE